MDLEKSNIVKALEKLIKSGKLIGELTESEKAVLRRAQLAEGHTSNGSIIIG
jgi:23S rRNA maturation mini-RNase III